MRVTFLGTGTSVGTPSVGCYCEVCTSEDPRNTRLRPSIWIEQDGFSLLVDTSPDLRQQALRHRIDRVDAVLYTHSHADHILGMDEVRMYNWRQRTTIPLHGNAETLANIRRTFWYAFEPVQQGGGTPRVELLEVTGPFRVGPFDVTPVPLLHGELEVLGYRFGSFAYCTDVGRIPEESVDLLQDLDTLVITALRHQPHPAHQTVEQALEWIERLAPREAWLTHMTHDLEHEQLEAETPENVHAAHDGLVLDL
jgi:phosphoribosyl 1,2-cyclic phosphate phosphodiesterase